MKTKLTILFLLLATTLMAQELKVKTFSIQENDMSAITEPVKDWNGDTCALVKIKLATPNVTFKGDIIRTKERPNEYWVYLVDGAEYIEIQAPGYQTFNYNFSRPLRMNCTYSLEIATPAQQALKVSSFSLDANDLSARSEQVKDSKGEVCALVKVGLVVQNANFSGDVVKTNKQTSEYWVYLADGATYIEVQAPGFQTLPYHFKTPLKKNCTYRLILQTQSRLDNMNDGGRLPLFYIQPSFQLGSFSSVGASIGMNISNFNVEVGAVKSLSKKEYYAYRPDGTEIGKAAFDAMALEARFGYSIKATDGLFITPQVGASFFVVSDGLLVDKANAISGIAGVRVSYSLAKNFALFATPSLSFKLTESDGYKQICEKADDLSKWSNGFNLKVGLSIEF